MANLRYHRPSAEININPRSRSEAKIYKSFASAPPSIFERIQTVRGTPPHLSLLDQAEVKCTQSNYRAINGWGHGEW